MLSTLAIILAALAVAAGVMGLVLMSQRDSARAEVQSKTTDLAVVTKQLVDVDNQRQRLESVIASLHSEVTSLEKELEACSDPKLVRDRFVKLFTSTTASANPAPSVVSNNAPTKTT